MPDFTFTSPEGKQYTVSGPAGATKEQAFAMLQKQMQNAPTAKTAPNAIPTPQKAEPIGPYLLDKAKQGLAEAAAAPGMLVDAVEAPLAAIGLGSSHPVGSSHSLYEGAAKGLGVKDTPIPTNEQGKPSKLAEYTGKMAEFGAASLVPGAGVVGAAERKMYAAGVELLGTAISAESAVGGKQIGTEVGGQRGGQIGEVLGSALGPLTVAEVSHVLQQGASSATRFIQDQTGSKTLGLGKEDSVRVAKGLAAKDLRESLSAAPMSLRHTQETVQVEKDIPGFNATSGRATNAPGIIAIEERSARKSPEGLAQAREAERSMQSSIKDFADQKFPPSSANIPAVAKAKYNAAMAKATAAFDRNHAAVNGLAEQYARDTTSNKALGDELVTLRNRQQEAAKAIKNAKYDAVYRAANATGVKVPVEDIRTQIQQFMQADAHSGQATPAVMHELLSSATPEASGIVGANGKPIVGASTWSFEKLHSFMRRVSHDYTAVYGIDPTRAYPLGILKDMLSKKVDEVAAQSPEVGSLLGQANDFWKNKYQAVFREGAGGKMVNETKWGRSTNAEDIVRSLLFKPRNTRGVSEFFDIYGDDKKAQSLLHDGIRDIFAHDVVRNGEINPALTASFFNKYKDSLDQLPGLKKELTDTAKMNEVLLRRRAQLQQHMKVIDSLEVAKLAQTEHPDRYVAAAVTSPRKMRALLSVATKGGPEARSAVARAIFEHVAAQENPFEYLTKHADSLKTAADAIGKDHWNNLVSIGKAYEITGRVRVPTHIELSKMQDLGERTIGTSLPGLQSQIQNTVRGYQSHAYAAFKLTGNLLMKQSKAQREAVLDSAIYDRDMLNSLLAYTNAPNKKNLNDLNNHIFAHGLRILTVNNPNAHENTAH